jgi:outer membrane protein assembly factor BamB
MKRSIGAVAAVLVLAAGLAAGTCSSGKKSDRGSPGEFPPPVVYDYDVPVKATSPWPMFRRTSTNSGRSPILPTPSAAAPWRFRTGKGIFHAPVIDEDGTVYIGSGDTFIYAIAPDGTEKWRFPTGEINDSSALIAADGTIFVPSGDGNFYALNPDGTRKWAIAALGLEGYITWWEGHVAMSRDGVLLAGNDDYHLYAIDQRGWINWTATARDQVWSCPAVGPDGTIYFGSNDLTLRSWTPEGMRGWWRPTLGPVASSPAVSDDGRMVVVGSFDGYVHAYDTAYGTPLWKFAARDHIYSSPAIGADGTIYVGSADGTMYAIRPDGTLGWAFDTLEPIRSSAAIDGDGNVYFGGADGKLTALRSDGSRLWSYDAAEGDRNDLNGSPAIGPDGIVIGGEEGAVVFVPFGYCETSGDPRCSLDPAEDVPDDGAFVYAYTAAGSSRPSVETPPAPMDVLTFRLVVRAGGDTVAARIDAPTLAVTADPPYPFHVETAANGQFFSIVPDAALAPGASYSITVSGGYVTGGLRIGNKVTGGDPAGTFTGYFPFTVASPMGRGLPLERTDDRVSVLRLRRMAVPQPPMLTTFNQIGFDSYNYLVSVVEIDPGTGRLVLLAVEGTPGLDPRVKPDTKTIFPLNGSFLDSFFTATGSGLTVDVSGVGIALDVFRVSALLAPDRTAQEINLFAEATCSAIERFGIVLNLLGLCHPDTGKLVVNGTADFAPHPGPEGTRPAGLAVASLDYVPTGGWRGGGVFEAAFTGTDEPAAEHLPAILVMDLATGQALELAYGANTEKLVDDAGRLAGVRFHPPAGFNPVGTKAVVLFDLFPLYEEAW